ncbi:MAG: hypothetical protein Q9199_000138 [Rusavskia elegans]
MKDKKDPFNFLPTCLSPEQKRSHSTNGLLEKPRGPQGPMFTNTARYLLEVEQHERCSWPAILREHSSLMRPSNVGKLLHEVQPEVNRVTQPLVSSVELVANRAIV